MKIPTKSLLLAVLMALAPAAYAQAQLPATLTDGVQETNPALITGSTFNVDADNPAPLSFTGDTSGATVSQINVLDGGFLSANNNNFDFTEINIRSGGDTTNSINIQNAELNVLPGGALGSGLTVGANSTLNVGSGVTDIGNNFTVAGTANINSGRHSIGFESLPGSTVNIGGTADIDGNTNVFAGVVNISGDAQIGLNTDFTTTSNVTVSGGTFGSNADFFGTANFTGGEFGSNFILHESATAAVFDDTDGGVTIASGGQIRRQATINGGDFTASLDFDPGSAGSIVNGGTFGNNVDISDNVTINGGTFGTNLDVGLLSDTSPNNLNPTVDINGGTFGEVDADSGTVNIFGGTFLGGSTGVALAANTRSDMDTQGTLNIHGGDIQGFIEGFGDINLFGTAFAIDGTPIDGLSSFTVIDGESVLTGTLEDGNTISLNLNRGFNFIDAEGLETVFTDSNEGDSFFGLFGENGNTGGVLTAGGTTIVIGVPEPSSLSLLALGALGMISRRRRS